MRRRMARQRESVHELFPPRVERELRLTCMRLAHLWAITCHVVLICGHNRGHVTLALLWLFTEGKETKRCPKWRKIKLPLEYVFFLGTSLVVLCV